MSSPANAGKASRRIAAFDGIRAFALGGVVIFHLLGLAGLVRAGDGGALDRVLWTIFGNTIDFFFIISGFLLFLPVIRRSGEIGSVRDFYLRRFGRLQPEYWVCLLVVVAMILLIPVAFTPPTPTAGEFVIHFFDLQTAWRLVDPNFNNGFWIDGAVWMVAVMAGLYLLFPLVTRFFYRHTWTGLLIAALITFGWKTAPGVFPGAFQSISGHAVSDAAVKIIATDQTPGFIFAFALGMAAARLYTRIKSRPENPWVGRGVLAVMLLAGPVWLLLSLDFTQAAIQSTTGLDGSSRGRGLALNGMGASLLRVSIVMAIALGPLWLQRPFASRPARWVADQSYGLYLIHLPIAFYALELLHPPQDGTVRGLLAWTAIVLPPTALYAWLSRRYIGQPSIRAVERWIAGFRIEAVSQSAILARLAFGKKSDFEE